jgi:NADP-dependent 3-hydroxy acid dehydrogenase YdfG
MSTREYAVITGASSGIGAATARALADNGFHVIAAARRIDKLNDLAASSANIEAFELDVTDQASVDSLVAHLGNAKVTVLVHSAGGAFDADSVMDSDPALWQKTFDINVVGAVRMVKALTPIFREHRKGHIVLITSTAAHRTYENGGSYAAAKFGEASLVDTLRLELNGEPIRISEIAPGIVKTEEFANIRYKGNTEAAAKIYEGIEKPLIAEDVAEAIRWVVMLPDHFNVDSMLIKPLAQAVSHKVYRKPIR